MDTTGLFITRKRKKWKFAHFNAWPNCVAAGLATPQTWPAFFGASRPLVVEVGAGTADLSVGLAAARPQDHFVAVDIKSDRLYTGAKYAQEHGLRNIMFARAGAGSLQDLFASQTVEELWITFPDPFERKKQAKHRLTHTRFLQIYKTLLTPSGVVYFKTDNRELFLWSLEQIVADGWQIGELSFDLHDSTLPEQYKITTAYERRFVAQGLPINFVSFALAEAQTND